MALNIDFSEFDFGALTTFLGIDAISSIVGLAKAYRDIDPIPDKSVHIKINNDYRGSNDTQLLSCILQAGTKPLNAIMYMHARNDESLKRVFQLHEVKDAVPENQIHAIKCLVAGLVIFISRGQLPSTQGNNAQTPLPKFITNIMNMNLKTENDLKTELMDFDPKHVNLKGIFDSAENFTGWDQILQNRFALGVAGHKPLKAIEALHPFLDAAKKETPGFKILSALHQAAVDGHNGFYPALHPAIQSFSTKYQQFYRNILRLIFDNMVGNEDTKHNRMVTLQMFKPDSFVKNEIRSHNLNITGWTPENILRDLGKPIKFGIAKGDPVKKSTLLFGQSKKAMQAKVEKVEEEQDPGKQEQRPTTKKVESSKAQPEKTTESKYQGDFKQTISD